MPLLEFISVNHVKQVFENLLIERFRIDILHFLTHLLVAKEYLVLLMSITWTDFQDNREKTCDNPRDFGALRGRDC